MKEEKVQQLEKLAFSLNLLPLTVAMVGADIRCSSLVDKDTANPTDIEVGAPVIICALVRFCLLEIIICKDL